VIADDMVQADGKIVTGGPTDTHCGNKDICSTDDLVADDDVFAGGSVRTGSPGSANCGGTDVCSTDDLVADHDIYAGGTKHAVIETASFGERLTVAYEGTQVRLMDQGRAQLKGGVATVALDPMFAEMIAADTLLVQVTLTSEANGVWVEITDKGFAVRELLGGSSDATFHWQVSAVRKGYEQWWLEESPVEKEAEEVDQAAAAVEEYLTDPPGQVNGDLYHPEGANRIDD
jgi:hypothetical protein